MYFVYEDAVAMKNNDQEIPTPKKSYKDSMMENFNGDGENNGILTDILTYEGIYNLSRDDDEKCLLVEERKTGQYDCSIFMLPSKEEERITKPRKLGVIVKLLNRKIRYKPLETRLKHIDQIEKVADLIRFSGLPSEHYDAKVLTSIDNIIGRVVKVEKNIILQERGKYMRLCVEVNLSKALLVLFTIRDIVYKVEYEWLHLLCINYEKFGHYMEGCGEKATHVANEKGGV
ncbi:hypothetical protein KIW84_023730 [Lathyrus oleraceus]|uniref:Uncharacterized protein n=1 Tax=Pisum sativum TaxID=3888 RepID=A0A9D5B8E6_PEA|nr:hypothetical protein KIW84_023730 [Pisum sativum]